MAFTSTPLLNLPFISRRSSSFLILISWDLYSLSMSLALVIKPNLVVSTLVSPRLPFFSPFPNSKLSFPYNDIFSTR